MAKARDRRMTAEVAAGMMDGKHPSPNPDRGGIVEATTKQSRGHEYTGSPPYDDVSLPDGTRLRIEWGDDELSSPY